LPAPDLAAAQGAYVAPQGETERLLAGIWGKLLGVAPEQVSASANFFALGGHSLLVVSLRIAIRQTFSVELHLRDIFLADQLRSLASKIVLGRLPQVDNERRAAMIAASGNKKSNRKRIV
uniref:phosphopantetheine-binding protein n=1 Tax=Janthinobacterium sp. PSPC1-1 TaxID=2804581 RepID=UPI003CEA29DC